MAVRGVVGVVEVVTQKLLLSYVKETCSEPEDIVRIGSAGEAGVRAVGVESQQENENPDEEGNAVAGSLCFSSGFREMREDAGRQRDSM